MAQPVTPEVRDFLAEVERIKAQYPATPPIGKTDPEALERLAGLFADDPYFEAAVRAGQEWRNADRPIDEEDEPMKHEDHAVPA